MNIDMLQENMIFRGMSGKEIQTVLADLRAYEKRYEKDSIFLHAGDTTNKMGLVLEGSVTIESNDMWGNRTILSHVGEGQYFAETYALLPDEVLLVDVRANEDCRILFLSIGYLFEGSESAAWKEKIMKNLLMISLHKNLALSGRSFHTSPKSCRGRLLAYLNSVSQQKHSLEFDIPFDRQQLADYLNLERTNMSKELGRMRDEGMIEYRKSHFKLLQPV
ncbi:MAG: Crp/Fnr family transcriptional regulator [Anaerolineaceae bacterium]|nr:Crp/Fnr family transcriptional regulator [Anaerolineaceae bacterium]